MSRALVVELLGPAGAGKSTLARDLRARDPSVRGPIGVWGLPLWALVSGALDLVPHAVALAWRGRLPPLHQLAQMARLGALRRVVAREARRRAGLVLLDEGPIFALAWLDVFFPQADPAVSRWRARTLRMWRAQLDAVVHLDAPDPVLVQRIRTRAKPHPVKHDPDDAIGAFTAQFRAAFQHALGELIATRPVTVLCVATHRQSSREAAVHVASALTEARRAG